MVSEASRGTRARASAYDGVVRHLALALALLAIAAPLAAQQAPHVLGTAWPLALRGALEGSRDHGCSQSHESVSRTADLSLSVDASGVARLEVSARMDSVFGPSRGRFAAGDRDFTYIHEETRAVLSGRATAIPRGVELAFDRIEEASIRWQGHGSLPLPPATSSPTHVSLRCELASTDVLPAEWSASESPSAHTLLACRWSAPPSALADIGADVLYLGRGAGVRTIASQRDFGGRTDAVRLGR